MMVDRQVEQYVADNGGKLTPFLFQLRVRKSLSLADTSEARAVLSLA